MGQTPKVSVIIPVYNAEVYIAQTIESVLFQTFQDFEALVIDDGSHDRSPDIIKTYAQKYPDKIKYVEHPNHKNCGVSRTRNHGIQQANGTYVAFLDADDLWDPEKLQRQVDVLDQYTEVGLVYTAIATINEHGEPVNSIGGHYTLGEGIPDTVTNAFDRFFSISIPMWLGSTILVRKHLLFEVGLFDTDLAYQCEDAIMSMKLTYFSPVYFLAQPLTQYRLHSNNASLSWIRKKEVKRMNYHVMTRTYQWLKHTSPECRDSQDFRVKLANLAHQAYQNHMISHWGLYKLLVRLFPYRSMNVRLLKIFISLGLGYTLTHKIQALWK